MDLTYPANISQIQFYYLGEDEVKVESAVEVKNKELFRNTQPVEDGPYSALMGTTDYSWTCNTCHQSKDYCPGHFGSLVLNYPLRSPIFLNEIIKWLRVICFNCGKPIINEPKGLKNVKKSAILSEYGKSVRNLQKNPECIHCGVAHPVVTKAKEDTLKLYAEFQDQTPPRRYQIYNHMIREVFGKVTNETVILLGRDPLSHPNKLVIKTIQVPPNAIRPDIKKLGGSRSNSNDLTVILKSIVEDNEQLPLISWEPTDFSNWAEMVKPFNEIVEKQIYTMELHYYELIKGSKSETTGNRLVSNATRQPLTSVAARLPKKEGLFRKYILGRRAHHMARSVITGDNAIKVNEVGIPQSMARQVQIPEVVQDYNKERLMLHFVNRDKTYPGCTKIIKGNTGAQYWVGNLDSRMELEIGDTLVRDLVTGDIVGMNRNPSLRFSSISGHRAFVLKQGATLRINVSACNMYNADFDGDAMNMIIPRFVQSRNEASQLLHLGRWFMSYQDNKPMVGSFQDGLIGMWSVTRDSVHMDKFHAMELVGQTRRHDLVFEKERYTGRDLVSLFLPPINYSGKPKFYRTEFATFVRYCDSETKVVIHNGKVLSGVLDKSSVGQTAAGGIYHIIHNEFGVDRALDVVFEMQQITASFFYHRGITVHPGNMLLPRSAIEDIRLKTSAIIKESEELTEKLNRGEIVPPIGVSVEDFYEQQQINILQTGDDFIEPIMRNIDVDTNGMAQLILTGSKGSDGNLMSMSSAIGQQTINGERMPQEFGYKRTSPFHYRFSSDPKSRGFIPDSYISGVSPDVFLFALKEARYGLINRSMNTAQTGAMNRDGIKNEESIVLDNNLRATINGTSVIQLLYGDDGMDPRRLENVRIPTVLISDSEFSSYEVKPSEVPKKYQNKNVEKLLVEEFAQLTEDRQNYREFFLKIEKQNAKDTMLSDSKLFPVNVPRVVTDVRAKVTRRPDQLNVGVAIQKVRDFCRTIAYSVINEYQEANNSRIPAYIDSSFTLFRIMVRSHLCVRNLMKNNIDIPILEAILVKIRAILIKSILDYGTAIGIIAAQSISEPMTQNVLDSHHRSGTGGSRTSTIARITEVKNAKPTSKMNDPVMVIAVDEQIKNNKPRIEELATQIEMLSFRHFVGRAQIFREAYKAIVHPSYVHENEVIAKFEQHNPNLRIPTNLENWCVRFELNRTQLVLKNMAMDLIMYRLSQHMRDIFFVNTDENSDTIFIRAYPKTTYKKKELTLDLLVELKDAILDIVLRGVKGINYTQVEELSRSVIHEDGTVSKDRELFIMANGTNTKGVNIVDGVNPYETQTDSIKEIEYIYGIEAARQKIINELRDLVPGASLRHYTIYADSMTYPGTVISIEKSGQERREMDNILLRAGTGHPIQTLESAASQSIVNNINGVSGPLCLGRPPFMGSLYNSYVLNEEFMTQNPQTDIDISDL